MKIGIFVWHSNITPFLRDVLYLGLHELYCIFVYFSCTASLFTCIVPHRRLHVLYFNLVYMYCTTLLITCTYFTFVYMYCTALGITFTLLHLCLHVLYCDFVCMYVLCCTFNYMHCTASLFTCSILHFCIHAHFLKTASLSVCTVHCTVNLITLYFIALKLQRMKDYPLFDLLQKNYIFRELNSFL